MNIRFYHARLLPLHTDNTISEGELWVCGDRIAYLGASKPCGAIHWDREIDLHGDLLMPGFKNAHTHSAMTFLRSYADDLPLDRWLHEAVFPQEAKLTEEDVYHFTRLAILEYLTSGITANLDMYRYPNAIAQAAFDCGFRTVLSSPLNDFTGSLEETTDCFSRYNQPDSLVSYRLGFHAEYTTSAPLLRDLAAFAQQNHAPVYTHLSETHQEVADCIGRYGMSPPAFLTSLGLFEYGGGAYHCVHVSAEDILLLRRQRVYVVTNPASNSKLASGIAPICKMLEAGIPIALGTDGPASNNCLDMFREMFLVTALQKLSLHNPSVLAAPEVLRMATCTGAHAMGLWDCDSLAVGKKADMIRIDLHRPNLQPLQHIAENLVYSGSKENIRMTMINGKILYEDGQFYVGDSPENIYDLVKKHVQRIHNVL